MQRAALHCTCQPGHKRSEGARFNGDLKVETGIGAGEQLVRGTRPLSIRSLVDELRTDFHMITSTFCLLQGIGRTTERRLWRGGITTWSNFLAASSLQGVSTVRKSLYDEGISEAQTHYTRDDARYFGVVLPQREQWRLYEWLRERAVYLDIETDSLGQITIVGCYGHGRF